MRYSKYKMQVQVARGAAPMRSDEAYKSLCWVYDQPTHPNAVRTPRFKLSEMLLANQSSAKKALVQIKI